MRKWIALVILVLFSSFSVGCAGTQVKKGERLHVLFTGDTWGHLVPTG